MISYNVKLTTKLSHHRYDLGVIGQSQYTKILFMTHNANFSFIFLQRVFIFDTTIAYSEISNQQCEKRSSGHKPYY